MRTAPVGVVGTQGNTCGVTAPASVATTTLSRLRTADQTQVTSLALFRDRERSLDNPGTKTKTARVTRADILRIDGLLGDRCGDDLGSEGSVVRERRTGVDTTRLG